MDVYIVLGIDRDATLGDIKRAYRRLARRFHPDVNPGDHAAALRFREIAEAYGILSDPDRRRRYDARGYEAAAPDAPAAGFEGFDFSAGVHANQQSTFGDLFAEVFRPEQAPSAEAGADLHARIALDFDRALAGGEERVTVTRQERCRECAGTGALRMAVTRCPVCQGAGAVRSARGHMVFSRPCVRCRGTGALHQQGCPACGGAGVQARTERVAVPFPPGATDGLRLRVPGKGHAGRNGGPAGDLNVTVSVLPHPVFRREGDDLHLVLPVGLHEAALGARIEVPTSEGTARLRLPPGTQSGQRFRLRGRGAPSPRDGRRGDLIVEARLMLPRVLDERSKELLREYGAINRESVRDDFEAAWREPARPAGAPSSRG